MNVCLLNDSFPPVIDGVANTVMNYAKILTEKDLAKVEVATPRYPGADYSDYPYEIVAYRSFSTGKMMEGYRAGNPLDIPALVKLAEEAPDIIHTHCPAVSAMVARSLRFRTKAPIIFTYHTKFDVDISHAIRSHFIQKEAIKTIVDNVDACDEVWTVSRGAGENLKSLGYTGDYRVVENGVDFPKGVVSDQEIREATAGYDLPEGVPMYLFVGRLMNYKGLPLIVDALKMLDNEGMDFRMVFIGDGVNAEEIKAKTEEYGLGNKIFFTGAIHDRQVLRAWNSRADLFMFPSTYDTNGIVVREAAACALASVLIRDSCAAEGITDGRNGLLIDETAESLAALLKELGNDIGRMKDLGEHAMNEIYISWEDSVAHAYDLYCEVLQKKAEGAYQTKFRQRMELQKAYLKESEEKWREHVRQTEDRWREALTGLGQVPSSIHEGMLEDVQLFKDKMKRAGTNVEKMRKNAWTYAKEVLYDEKDEE